MHTAPYTAFSVGFYANIISSAWWNYRISGALGAFHKFTIGYCVFITILTILKMFEEIACMAKLKFGCRMSADGWVEGSHGTIWIAATLPVQMLVALVNSKTSGLVRVTFEVTDVAKNLVSKRLVLREGKSGIEKARLFMIEEPVVCWFIIMFMFMIQQWPPVKEVCRTEPLQGGWAWVRVTIYAITSILTLYMIILMWGHKCCCLCGKKNYLIPYKVVNDEESDDTEDERR